ncbi:MAG: hypothetical protein U0X87_13700 [Anaerolineales bacterium]
MPVLVAPLAIFYFANLPKIADFLKQTACDSALIGHLNGVLFAPLPVQVQAVFYEQFFPTAVHYSGCVNGYILSQKAGTE